MTALPPAAPEGTLPASFGAAIPFFQRAFCWRANLDYLRSPNMALLGAGLLLPNLLSLATLGSFIDVGLPPRTGCILLYATLAVCARRLPFALTAALFVALLGFDLVWTLSLMFGLAPDELLVALDHAKRIHFFASPLYVSLIAVMLATTAATLYLLSRRTKLLQGNIYVLLGVALAFAALDFVTNVSAHYQYGSMFGRNVPVVSAADASGFNAIAGADGRNVVLVIVESLGYLIDPKDRALIDSPLALTRASRRNIT